MNTKRNTQASPGLSPRPLFLGIECGATRTQALLVQEGEVVHSCFNAGPANLRLLTDARLERHFRRLAREFARPNALGIGMAGARTNRDHDRIKRVIEKVWPRIPAGISHDLNTALLAADTSASPKPSTSPRRTAGVLILSGTGSCCFGRTAGGRTCKIGGWGHILGDKGSGYEIGLRSLKALVYYYDREGSWARLGSRILRALQLNEPEDLINWVGSATKDQVAALAVEVFAAWKERDKVARDVLQSAAASLCEDAIRCAAKLAPRTTLVDFIFAGGVLLNQPKFRRILSQNLKRLWPSARVHGLQRPSVWGAVELARQAYQAARFIPPLSEPNERLTEKPKTGRYDSLTVRTRPICPHPTAEPDFELSPTERRNPRSMNLEQMPLREAVKLMLTEDESVPRAILREAQKLERATRLIVKALRRGGRLLYVGAGTSGRLGVLDAAECPPTFQTSPEMVQGIIAGGSEALARSVEGAEDNREAGILSIRFRNVSRRDVVVGIAASGRTPFVWGALEEAGRRKAPTILVCFNPSLRIPPSRKPTLLIAPSVGPEILTGSTRLKAGTATKLILNLFTTLSMTRLGKVMSNLMVDLNPSNTKLRDRAVRIVQALTSAECSSAQTALENSGWNVRTAISSLKRRPTQTRVSGSAVRD